MVNHPACIHIGQSFACLRGQAFISIAQPGGHSFCLDLIVRHEPDVSPALLDFCLPGHPPQLLQVPFHGIHSGAKRAGQGCSPASWFFLIHAPGPFAIFGCP
jgi:hypothetical protein